MTDYYETKSQPISKLMVWKAYRKVKANGGSAGIDQVSLEVFSKDLSRNLYKLWNRLSSGSYFPPPVKQVKIPKKSGGQRSLGIPTVADRIAQQVVKSCWNRKWRQPSMRTAMDTDRARVPIRHWRRQTTDAGTTIGYLTWIFGDSLITLTMR